MAAVQKCVGCVGLGVFRDGTLFVRSETDAVECSFLFGVLMAFQAVQIDPNAATSWCDPCKRRIMTFRPNPLPVAGHG